MSAKEIKITGARVNNLKNVNCNLPHEKLTVITGPSGSGKSSLAFDTLYAEGQRRYIESMSSYARQFLARIEKPDVDNIQHILPAIALEQKNHVKNARSTVGTATEIYDYLRMLFAHIGVTVCDVCNGDVSRADPFKIQEALRQYPEGLKILLLAPVHLKDFSIDDLIRQGFFRVYRNNGIVELTAIRDELSSHDTVRIVIDRLIVKHKALGARLLESIRNALVLGNGKIEVVNLDYTPVAGEPLDGSGDESATEANTSSSRDSGSPLPLAHAKANPLPKPFGQGLEISRKGRGDKKSEPDVVSSADTAGNAVKAEGAAAAAKVVDSDAGQIPQTRLFRNAFACMNCHKEFTEPFPNFFSFNSPMGACPSCEGFGRIIGIDMDKVIPNKHLSLSQGAIHPFTKPSYSEGYDYLAKECKKRKIPLDVPWIELTDEQKAFVIEGGGSFDGVRGFFEWLDSKKYKMHVRIFIAKYRGFYPCPDCLGSRLRRETLSVFVAGKNILQIGEMPVHELLAFFEAIELPPTHEIVADRLLKEIRNRLRYLNDIGLTYLTLNRHFRTLSNGEAQRINLSSALGSALTDTLYVLDEPTVGLHARDTDRLVQILKNLRDLGNTLVIVEHDPEVMLEADHLVDMGPSGGEEGGRIIFEGSPSEIHKAPYSLTARYLPSPQGNTPGAISNGKKGTTQQGAPKGGGLGEGTAPSSTSKRNNAKASNAKPQNNSDSIQILGAKGNNLQNLNASLPKNTLVCVTGVSGSGKSTLIKQTLFAAYEHRQSRSLELDEAPHDDILGLESFKDVLMVDQSPPGRSARSNPVTYVKAYDDIRKLFAESRKAVALGITPGHFSFNTPGGRCETCEGLGTLTIDMQFMADVTVICHDCQGRRFNLNVLSIELEGKSIFDVLNMTIDEAIAFFGKFFSGTKKIVNKLKPLQEIGLGYLKLGQSTSTLSGGEAQRLKLASYLPSYKDEEVAEAREKFLFLFDEPTTGLHMADIDLLVQAFRRLLAAGHSLVVIEHNIDFIAQADWIVDLGPEGGDGGGLIVAEGTVEDVMEIEASHTGRFLKKRLETPKALQASV